MIAAATLLVSVAAAAAPPQPVQLCGCDEAARGAQTWLWGNRTAGGVTAPAPLRLRADPSRCLYAGQVAGRSQPHALYVDDCARATPPNFSFVPSMRPQDTRDTSVLRAADPALAHMCADAAGMTAEMQLYACVDNDNDQQYTAIDSYGLIVDLWTGYSNCLGVAGADCAAPKLFAPPPTPPAPPAAPSAFGQRWCPRYHASKGTDPSGALILDGQVFVFPDGSDDNTTIPPHHYVSATKSSSAAALSPPVGFLQ